MREQKEMFLWQRWHRLLVNMEDLLLKNEENLSGEMNCLRYCLEGLRRGEQLPILEVLSEYEEVFDRLHPDEELALRRVMMTVDWFDPEEAAGAAGAVKSILRAAANNKIQE